MANEIFTRIQLKYDSWANWSTVKDTFKPLKGEVCIVNPGENSTSCLLKVGDGEKFFGALPWVEAPAADVYAWAKAKDVRLNGQKLEFHNDGVVVKEVDLSTFATEAEVEAITGKLANLATDAKTSLVAAINELDTRVDDISIEVGDLFANVGDPEGLATSAKTNLVAAINEHDTEIGNLTGLNTTNKGNLVAAINETLQAVEVGGTGSVVTVVKDGDNTYKVKQGENFVDVPIVINDGTLTVKGEDGLTGEGTFGANQEADGTITLKHEVPTGAAAGDNGEGGTLITSITTDKFGHIIGHSSSTVGLATGSTNTTPKIEVKVDGTYLAGDCVAFKGENGISVAWGEHDLSDRERPLIIDGQGLKDYTDEKVAAAVAGAVDFLGVVGSAEELTAAQTKATNGDFVRVGTAFGEYHPADLLVWDDTTKTWLVIHGEEGDITEVKGGEGLTGEGASGSVTISHGAKPTTGNAQAATAGSGRTYITEVTVDKFGHVAGVKTATESDQDLSGYKTKQDVLANTFEGAHGIASYTQTANGELDIKTREITPELIGAATAAQGAKADRSLDDVWVVEGYSGGDSVEIVYGALATSEAPYGGEDKIAKTLEVGVIKGGITTEALADNAVTTAKINDGAVTAAKLADDVKELIKTEAATLDAVVLAESQKYTNDAIGDLHAIATSGSIYDIAEGHKVSIGTDDAGAKYIVFNCGSSTEVI